MARVQNHKQLWRDNKVGNKVIKLVTIEVDPISCVWNSEVAANPETRGGLRNEIAQASKH